MTISSTASSKTYSGNGVTTSFDTNPVVFFDTSDLIVYVVEDATGDTTTLVENTDYTVSGGSGSTGTVSTAGGTSPYGAPASGYTLIIDRQIPIKQLSDFVNNDSSDAEVVEEGFDRLTMIAQQQNSLVERALHYPLSDILMDTELPVASDRGNTLLGFDADGAVKVYEVQTGTSLVSLAATNGATLVGHGESTIADIIHLDLRKFGGAPGGIDNTQAFLDAMEEIDDQGVHGVIHLGAGQWYFNGYAGADGIVNGLYVPYGSGFSDALGKIIVEGEGISTQLMCGSNNMIMARWSGCYGGLRNVAFNPNGKTGCKALYVGHDSSTSTASAQTQEHNDFDKIWVMPGFDVGFWLRPGAHVSGVDSQVLSNDFSRFHVQGAVRGILLDDNIDNSVGTSNRNNFTKFAIGQTGTNIGVEIRTGSQNNFSHGVINGVDTGVKTGVLIENTGNGALANELNCFTMVNCENNVTYDMNNANANTQIFGGFWNFVAKFTGTLPGTIIPSHSYVSFMPMRLPGLTYGEGVSGFSSGSIGLTVGINDTNQPWTTFTSLVEGDFTNVAALSGLSAIEYTRLNKVVTLNWRMTFQASVAATRITIPAAKLATVNSGLAPDAEMIAVQTNNALFSVFANNGTNVSAAEAGFTSTGDLYINAPSGGNWATGAATNIMNIIVQYKAA